MKVLTYKPSSRGFIVFLILTVLVIVFAVPMFSTSKGVAGEEFLVFLLVLLVLLFATPMLAVMRRREAGKAVSKFMREASIGETITLPVPVRYEIGTYICTGEWRGGGRSRHYYTHCEFRKSGEAEGASITLPTGPFTVTVKRDDSGLLKFPAVKITSKPYRGVLLLVMDPKGTVKGSGDLQVTWGNDMAQLSFQGTGKKLTGTVYATVQRARKAKVEVYNKALRDNRFKIGEGVVFNFSKRLLPDERTVVVAPYGFSPRDLRRLLGGGEYVLGHGDYALRLVLDIPLHRDVIGERGFKVVFEENKGEEKSAMWW